MSPPMLAVLFAAALSAAPAPVKLAAPGLQSVNVKTQLALFLSDELHNRLREQGLEVITSKDIELILGIERQKQLLGCSDGNCIAELSNALGADAVITGSIGMFGDNNFRVLISIVSAESGKPIASWSGSASGQRKTVELLGEAAESLAKQLFAALHREPPAVTLATSQPKRSPWGFVFTGGALGFAGLSAGLFIAAGNYDSFLKCDPGQPCASTTQQAQAAHDNGQLMQDLAIGSVVAAAICLGLAVWMFVTD